MQMVLGVMEGQIRGGYFPDYILDPSVVDCIQQPAARRGPVGGVAEDVDHWVDDRSHPVEDIRRNSFCLARSSSRTLALTWPSTPASVSPNLAFLTNQGPTCHSP